MPAIGPLAGLNRDQLLARFIARTLEARNFER